MPDNKNSDTLTLLDLLFIFGMRLKLIMFVTLASIFIAIIYVQFIAEPVFNSISKITSSSSKDRQSSAFSFASQFGLNIPNLSQSGPEWVYIDILKSRNLAKSVLNREFYSNQIRRNILIGDFLLRDQNISLMTDAHKEDVGIMMLHKMLDFKKDIKTNIYTIRVEGADKDFIIAINKAFIEELDLHQRNYNKSITSETRIFIEDRIKTTRSDLENAEEKLKNFNDRNRRIENSPALQLSQQRLQREVTVLTQVFTTLKQNLETSKIEDLKESTYIIEIDEPFIPLIPISPKKAQVLFIASILGFSISLSLGLIIDYLGRMDKKEKKKLAMLKEIIFKNINIFSKV